MNFLKKIPPLWLKIYRPVIYILTLVLVWMGAVNNNKLNLNVADSTGGAFDTIENLGEIRKGTLKEYEQKLEQRLKDGDASQAEIEDLKAIIDDLKHNEKGVVLICFDFDAGCDAEMTPQAVPTPSSFTCRWANPSSRPMRRTIPERICPPCPLWSTSGISAPSTGPYSMRARSR